MTHIKLEKAFEVVKSGDLEKVEKFLDIKVPGVAKSKAEELLKKAADNLNPEGIAKMVHGTTLCPDLKLQFVKYWQN